MPLIRVLLGAIILLIDWATTPRSIKRDAQTQSQIDEQARSLTLYPFKACPFCVKVRRAMKRHSLNIELKDAKRCLNSRQELLSGGGKIKTPCLRIENASGETTWMYESNDIIAYLEKRFIH